MYDKILVASMGEYMDQILLHTKNLLENRKTEILGVYVVETSAPFLTPRKVKEMMIRDLRVKGQQILDQMEKAFISPGCAMIKFRKIMLKGDPAEEIVKTAERENVDLIILGTGKNIVDKHLLGSVSEKVVHSTPCSLLLVRTVKSN